MTAEAGLTLAAALHLDATPHPSPDIEQRKDIKRRLAAQRGGSPNAAYRCSPMASKPSYAPACHAAFRYTSANTATLP